MDTTDPQMQNPNLSQVPPPTGGSNPMGPQPMTSQGEVSKKKTSLFWMVVLIALAVAAVAWWYVSNMMVPVIPMVQQPEVNQEAREDALISNDIQGTDLGDLNKEFESVDKDLNSL